MFRTRRILTEFLESMTICLLNIENFVNVTQIFLSKKHVFKKGNVAHMTSVEN